MEPLVFGKRKQAAEYLNSVFTDCGTNRFMFGVDAFESRDLDGCALLYRMLNFTFVCIYAKWKRLTRVDLRIEKSFHCGNVFNVFDYLYKTVSYDFDVMMYVIKEAKRDVDELGENSFFSEFFTADLRCRYSEVYTILKKELFKQAEVFQYRRDLQYNYNVLVAVVQDLRFMGGLRITCDGGYTTFSFGGCSYDVEDMVYSDATGRHILVEQDIIDQDAKGIVMEYSYLSLEGNSVQTVVKKTENARRKL